MQQILNNATQNDETSQEPDERVGKYIVFDTETDAIGLFRPPTQTLIQLAWIVLDSRLDPLKEKCSFVKGATTLGAFHKIITMQNVNEGETAESVLSEFIKDVVEIAHNGGCLVAHNIEFDVGILLLAGERAGVDMMEMLRVRKFCTQKQTTEFCGKLPKRKGSFSFPTLADLHMKLFEMGFENAHDALGDTKATARCFRELERRHIYEI